MDMEGESTLTQAMRRFTGAEQKAPSLEIVKGALLATADTLLSTLSELVIENAQYDKGMTNFENVANNYFYWDSRFNRCLWICMAVHVLCT